MKKLLYCAAALSAVLFAGSCQRENLEPVVKGGVTYTISLPETVQTKGSNGYAEGYDLYYEVYKTADLTELEKAEVLFDNFNTPIEMTPNTPTKVPFDLLNDQDYTILFWANKAGAKDENGQPYFNLDDLRKVGINAAASNNNDRDAFCTMDQLRNVNGALTKTVTLTRPFAQLNIATEIPNAGYDVTPKYSYVKVTKVPTVYNVATEAATGDAVVEFATAAVPAAGQKVAVGAKEYDLVAMNYVLVPEGNINVYYAIETANGVVTNTINNVPVKKNYRTNIIGNLLTSNATYTVELKPGFEEGDEVCRVVSNSQELAAAVAEAKSGDTIYIEGEMEIPFFTNKSLSFVGISKATSVIIDPSCKQDTKRFENSQLYFENLTMRGSGYGGTYKSSHGYVGAVAETYNDCVFENYFMFWSDVTTINDCVFNGIEGQYFWTGNSDELTFNNCQFNGVDRALNVCGATPGEERVVTFNNCTFSASKQNKAALEIDGSNAVYTVNINNSSATGFKPSESTGEKLFNIKKAPENVTVYVNGRKWVGVGKFEDTDGTTIYTTTATLQAAIAAAIDGDVILLGDAKFDGIFEIGDKTITLKAADGCKPEVAGRVSFGGSTRTTLTCENIKFSVSENTGKNIGNSHYDSYAGYIVGNYGGNVVMKECNFTGMTDDFGAIYYYAHTGGTTTENLEKLTVIDCNFNGGRAIRSRANVIVTNSTFTGLVENNPCLQIVGLGEDQLLGNVVFTDNESDSPRGICIKTSNHSIKNVTFNVSNNIGCNTITFDSKNLNNLYLDTYSYIGNVKSLSPENSEGLQYLVTKKVPEINLLPVEYQVDLYVVGYRESLSIKGTEGTKLAFKNQQVRALEFKYLTIDNCEILKMAEKSWGHLVFSTGDQSEGVYTVSNCTFNGVGTQGIYINENVSGATYNILNCTFNGDFGGEGAVTIQNNLDVQHIVNVKNCSFNNIPSTSHKVFVKYSYNGWTLTGVDPSDVYWAALN